MKKVKIIVSLITLVVASGFIVSFAIIQKTDEVIPVANYQKQMVNLFVTHGHCSTPFSGNVENLKLETNSFAALGNPMEDMNISFEINPYSFAVCRGEGLTEKIQTPGLFVSEDDEMISFRTTQVFTMGLDWYQINGKLSIKGVERDIKLFATGIRGSEEIMPSYLILEGQFNLFDWDIDYDKIVNGESVEVSTRWMHLNMKIEMC
ncbi:MAG: YceI family protein [Crocinitomicaceae bacterium]